MVYEYDILQEGWAPNPAVETNRDPQNVIRCQSQKFLVGPPQDKKIGIIHASTQPTRRLEPPIPIGLIRQLFEKKFPLQFVDVCLHILSHVSSSLCLFLLVSCHCWFP